MTDAAPRIEPEQLEAYFALIEVGSLLRHAVEQQLREAGGLSYVQFQLLATLGDLPGGSARMTDLADRVVYSRSGLTYQAGLLEQAGLVSRSPAEDDERSTTVTITAEGRARLGMVFPGHIEALQRLLLEPMTPEDVRSLSDVLGRVRAHMRRDPPRSAAPRRARTRSEGQA
jgi:DNA-binding MarR family transcriptional regulator